MAIYDRYFEALEDGTAQHLYPDPTYQWRFYQGDCTIERFRKLLRNLDAYWWGQRSWGPLQNSAPIGGWTAGPELSRLPDPAVMALYQEIDALLAKLNQEAQHGYGEQ